MGEVGPVLVTGGGGLLAREVADAFASRRVILRTRESLDVTDGAAVARVMADQHPSVVVHCAAMTNVDACEEAPERAFEVNEVGSRHVATAAAEHGAAVVAVSTDYVFDGEKGGYVETDPTNPIQVYGRSKLAGEEAVREANPKHFVVRSAWIYGRGGKSFLSKLPGLAAQGTPLKAVVDQIGSPTYAPQLAGAICALAATEAYGTYHVVNEGTCSFADFCRHLLGELGAEVDVEEVTRADLRLPAPRPRDTSLLTTGWRRAGFDPLPTWQQAAAAFAADN